MCPVNTHGTNPSISSGQTRVSLLSFPRFTFKLCGEQQALPPPPPWSTMDFRSWLLVYPELTCPPFRCCLPAMFAVSIESSHGPSCWKNLPYFWTSPFSEGKQLIHTLLWFPSRVCWQPAIPLEPLREPVTSHRVLWPTQLAESSGCCFSQKTCMKGGRDIAQQIDLLILDLGFVPPAFTLHPLKTWIVGGMPFSLTVYVLRVIVEAMQFPWSHFMAPS